jgi:hypothetical protein
MITVTHSLNVPSSTTAFIFSRAVRWPVLRRRATAAGRDWSCMAASLGDCYFVLQRVSVRIGTRLCLSSSTCSHHYNKTNDSL